MNVGRALAYLLHYKPEYWFELLHKFDSDGTYRRKLNIDLDESGEKITSANRKTRSIPLLNAKVQRIATIYLKK